MGETESHQSCLVPPKWDKSYWVLLSATSATTTILVPKPDTSATRTQVLPIDCGPVHRHHFFNTKSVSIAAMNKCAGRILPLICVIFTERCLFHDPSTISCKYRKSRESSPCSPKYIHEGSFWESVVNLGCVGSRTRPHEGAIEGFRVDIEWHRVISK